MDILIYVLIFVGKLVEVTIATIRVVLTARGNRIVATLLSTVEIAIWVIVAGTVLTGMHEDPLKAVMYSVAFVIGIYVGIIIEDKLALGLSQIECIAGIEEATKITETLRSNGYGVTVFDCEGRSGKKQALNIKVLRKDVPKAIAVLKEYDHLFVTVTDIKKLSIGSIGKRALIK